MMWEIGSSGGLGHWWPTPNSWDRGKGKEEEINGDNKCGCHVSLNIHITYHV